MTIPPTPDPSVDKRLIRNLRRSRLELEEVGLELEALIARFDERIRQQRRSRVQRSLNSLDDDSNP